MYIHVGNKQIISDKNAIGIFNIDTLKKSEINEFLLIKSADTKSVVILENNNIIESNISPYTLIKRKINTKDIFWSSDNVK